MTRWSTTLRRLQNSLSAMTDFVFRGEETSRQSITELRNSEIEWDPRPGEDSGYMWGGKRIRKRTRAHSCVTSMPRGGKTTTLRLLMQDTLPDVLHNRNTRALIYDPKREMVPILHGIGVGDQTIILDPFDARSHAWDMAKDITDERESQILADVLLPERKGNKGEDFFTSGVRNLLKAVVYGFVKSGKHWEFCDVIEVMRSNAAIAKVAGSYRDGSSMADDLLTGHDDTVRDIRASITNDLGRLAIIARLWHLASLEGRTISISDWLNQDKILILPAPRGEGDPIVRMNQIFFESMASRILASPEADDMTIPPMIWIIIDELRYTGGLPSLNLLLVQGASKGARVILGFQDIAGLRDAFGENKAAEIVALCANQAFLRAGSGETATWGAEHFGKVLVHEPQITKGPGQTTVTRHTVERPVLLNRSLLDLPLPLYRPPDEIADLEGYYRTDRFNCYHSKLSAARIFDPKDGMLKPKAEVPNFIERPAWQKQIEYEIDLSRFDVLNPPDWHVRGDFESEG